MELKQRDWDLNESNTSSLRSGGTEDGRTETEKEREQQTSTLKYFLFFSPD
jgi:hypothetical protein